MKIEISISTLSEVQKAKIVSQTGKLPERLIFDMSPKYVAVLAEMKGTDDPRSFSVNPDGIYFGKIYVAYEYGYDDTGHWTTIVMDTYPVNSIAAKVASGELLIGGSIDTVMEEMAALIQKKQEIRANAARIDKEKRLKDEAERPAREAAQKAELEARAKKEAEEKTKAEEEKKKQAAEAEARKQKRISWAQEHGSERLKKGLEQGHACIKLYETELGEHLIADSDYEYDRERKVEEKGRSCPSLDALNEVERISKIEGLSAVVVWLPEGLGELYRDPEDYFEPEGGCEAVQIDVQGTAGYWYKKF